MKSEDKLESILQRLTYYNNYKGVMTVPTYDTIEWEHLGELPFNLQLADQTVDPLYVLDLLLSATSFEGAKMIGIDHLSFCKFIMHPYVYDLSKAKLQSLPREYMKHLNSMWDITGRWLEISGRIFVELNYSRDRMMLAATYKVKDPTTIEGKIEQQFESLLLHLGDN